MGGIFLYLHGPNVTEAADPEVSLFSLLILVPWHEGRGMLCRRGEKQVLTPSTQFPFVALRPPALPVLRGHWMMDRHDPG